MIRKISFILVSAYIAFLGLLAAACFYSGDYALGALYLVIAGATPLPSWTVRQRVDAICDRIGIL